MISGELEVEVSDGEIRRVRLRVDGDLCQSHL